MDSLSDLRVFQHVVEAGSFVQAAAQLRMTPSGVSKRLSRYEARLGARLLNRTTRSLSLTEAGEALYVRGRSLLAEIEQAEGLASNAMAVPSGQLRVSCSDAFAMKVLIPTLVQFHSDYPEVSVSVLQGDGPIDMVSERVDVAIRFEAPGNSDFVARPLIEDPWVVCASPSYIARHGSPTIPDELHRHRCLTIRARDVETNRWHFLEHNRTRVIEVESVFSGIGAVVREAAVAGLGVARLAQFLVKDGLERGELVRLLPKYAPVNERSIFAVYPHREYLPLKVRLLVDYLALHFGV